MKAFIVLFVLILFGSLGFQSHDLLEWYRVYKTEGYVNADSTNYIEIDLRLYPPEFRFYDDTTMAEYSWKLSVWFYQSKGVSLTGPIWNKEYTVTYGKWIYMGDGCMFLGADSLKKDGSIVWRRQKEDKGKNSYFLFDYGLYYALKVFNTELVRFAGIIVFSKEDQY